jgi:hypothetical protein
MTRVRSGQQSDRATVDNVQQLYQKDILFQSYRYDKKWMLFLWVLRSYSLPHNRRFRGQSFEKRQPLSYICILHEDWKENLWLEREVVQAEENYKLGSKISRLRSRFKHHWETVIPTKRVAKLQRCMITPYRSGIGSKDTTREIGDSRGGGLATFQQSCSAILCWFIIRCLNMCRRGYHI